MPDPTAAQAAPARHAAVVGGGLAGLAAAALLARHGTPVTVYEGAGAPGGRARSTPMAGAAVNLGPHAWSMGGPATSVLADLGVELAGGTPPPRALRLLAGDRLVHPLARRGGGAGLRGVGALARLVRRTDRAGAHETVAQWLAREVVDPRARAVAGALARLVSYTAADDVQAAEVPAAGLAAQPVRYLDGGWQRLTDQLADVARAAGAQVRAGQPVRRVTVDGGRVTGVVTADGVHHPAAAVVLAAGGPQRAAELVDGAARDVLAGWARRATPVAMATLDLVLDHRPADAAPLVLGVDEPLYLSVHSDWARLADGGAVVHVARYLRPGERGDDATRARLEALADRAVPGWRAATAHARFLPAVTVTHDVGAADAGGISARPGPGVPGVGGLYVAGDWVGARGYLAQASVASAADAARRATRQLDRPGAAAAPSSAMLNAT